ncbi:MAG: class II glutamine amidotransferase [Candidatus Heimdallarchaeota archaeon]|nr:class II glutamine amidotransferase [Candidatus Heimdallarchaeota archaeon]
MCRLLGIFRENPIWQEIALEFQKQAEVGNVPPEATSSGHKDGWGMAYSKNNEKMILLAKGLGSALESERYLESLKSLEFSPHVFLCHLRKASPKIAVSYANTHPFFWESWAFIHNGTVHDANQLSYDISYPLSSEGSDSEYFFRYLMKSINKNPKISVLQNLVNSLDNLTVQFTAINFLLSNGKILYSLRWAKQNLNYYSLYFQKHNSSIIFSSEPIGFKGSKEYSWEEIPNKTLLEVSMPSNEIRIESHSFD